MALLTPRIRSGIGLDQVKGTLIVAQIRKDLGEKASIHRHEITGADTTERQADLSRIYGANLLDDTRTAVALPSTMAIARWIQTPFQSPAKARRVLASLLDLQLPFPVEQCAAVFPELDTTPDEGTKGLAIAVWGSELEEQLAGWGQLGFNPDLVFHEAVILWRFARAASPPGPSAILHLHESHATLVFGSGARFESAHGLPMGMEELGHDQTRLRFVQRIRHIMQSRETKHTLPIHFTGPGAKDAQLVGQLQTELCVEAGSSTIDGDPETALARALARAAWDATMHGGNLRIGEYENPANHQQRQRQAVGNYGTAIAAALVLILINAGWRWSLDLRAGALQNQLIERASKLSGIPPDKVPKGQEVFAVKQALGSSMQRPHPFARIFMPSAAHTASLVTAAAYEKGVTISEIHVHAKGFRASGLANSPETAEQMRQHLSAQGFTVELQERSAADNDPVFFKIRGYVDDE